MESTREPFILHPENRDFIRRYWHRRAQVGRWAVGHMWIAALQLVGFLLILGTTVGRAWVVCALINRNGGSASAIIDELRQRPERSTDLTGRPIDPNDIAYSIRYRFVVGGVSYSRTESITAADFQALKVGNTIPVRYWRSNPSVVRRAGSLALDQTANTLMVVWMGIMLAIPIGIFLFSRREFRRRRAILGDGDLLPGTVESAKVEPQSDGTSIVELAYRFKLVDGTPRQGTDRATPPDTPRVKPGEEVFVIASADRASSRLI